MKSNRLLLSAAFLVAPLFVAACGDDDPVATPDPLNIVETAQEAGSFTTLITALDATGLTSALEGPGPFTVFAPTDDAFAALPAGTLEALLADPDALAAILLYHVAEGDLRAGDVVGSTFIPTLNGQAVTVGEDGGPTIDGAAILTADILASNGVIHVIDQVILPSDENIVEIALGNESFSTLVTALTAADLVGALQGDGPFTVFAPTDEAFAAVPADMLAALLADVDALTQVLTYHVVPGRVLSSDVVAINSAETLNGASVSITVDGGAVRVDDANIIATDIQGTNGVIHVIDQVILPATLMMAQARRAEPISARGKNNNPSIAEIAIGRGFSELVGALSYVDEELNTGLVDLFLNGKDQYTVFAPTNTAFADLYALLRDVVDPGIDGITDVPATIVRDVLLYHVAEGRRGSNSVVPRNGERRIESLLGETFAVRTDGTIRDGLTGLRDDAAITGADNSARNGIVHVINQVIVPPSVVAALTAS
ncbi:MAG: fasciclin domain-containing protein [Gemmatimonadota bacterium]|jgi:transforming growth factor-beta-induced protein